MVALVGRRFGRGWWVSRGGSSQELVNALRSVCPLGSDLLVKGANGVSPIFFVFIFTV